MRRPIPFLGTTRTPRSSPHPVAQRRPPEAWPARRMGTQGTDSTRCSSNFPRTLVYAPFPNPQGIRHPPRHHGKVAHMHPFRRFRDLQLQAHMEVMARAVAGMPHGMRRLWAMIPLRLRYPDIQGPEASPAGRPRPPFLISLATTIPWHLMVAMMTCPRRGALERNGTMSVRKYFVIYGWRNNRKATVSRVK